MYSSSLAVLCRRREELVQVSMAFSKPELNIIITSNLKEELNQRR